MADVDPETLLEWLSMGQGDERDMQLIALEQLCMLLLMSDNVDRCFERYITLDIKYFNITLEIKVDFYIYTKENVIYALNFINDVEKKS